MVREKKSMIGFDPLAWLEDEKSDTVNTDQPVTKESEVKKNDVNETKDVVETGLEETVEVEELEATSLEAEQVEVAEEIQQPEDDEVEVMEQKSTADISAHPGILLKAIQDISKVQELKGDILVLIKDNDEIDIDGEAVERIDGSSLQLLCALFDYADHNALIVNWVNPSDALKQSVKILGMQEALHLH